MTLVEYDTLAEESWARLEEAADSPSHPMRLIILATIAADGTPDARMMVLRGANRQSGRIWFYTDRRSEKVTHLRDRPSVCAVAYDRHNGVQLRLRGNAVIHDTNSLAAQHWEHTSSVLRWLYASPDAPGLPLRQPDPRIMSMKQDMNSGVPDNARGNFAVIEIVVKSIEWHQVCEADQRRAILHAATAWAVQPLAP
ncbi:MAG: pyridoxamine 5'-phosphate oxidase family protein [Planctomycetota bacterium]|jgi:general stress protein 26